jgi:hypothetical protein
MEPVFLWDPSNLNHIAEHRVRRDEAESVVRRASRPFPQAIGPRKYLVRGQSAGGRYLQVIYVERSVDMINMSDLDPKDRLYVNDVEDGVTWFTLGT